MAYWLLKTEPSTYSFDDLVREKRTAWTGVANAAALKNMRGMKKGDELLIYHTGDEKAVVGRGTVVRDAYADPAAGDEKLVAVDIAVGSRLARPVTLAEIKAEKKLANWGLVRIGRLSVVPTTEAEFNWVIAAAG